MYGLAAAGASPLPGELMMRLVDGLLGVPRLPLYLVLLTLIGPGYWRTDASLFKRFALISGHSIEFRIEAVNLFNTVNLGNPDSEIGVPGNLNPNAGRITSTAYGGSDPMRNFQFAFKYIF